MRCEKCNAEFGGFLELMGGPQELICSSCGITITVPDFNLFIFLLFCSAVEMIFVPLLISLDLYMYSDNIIFVHVVLGLVSLVFYYHYFFKKRIKYTINSIQPPPDDQKTSDQCHTARHEWQ